jgi:putative transposase
MSRKYKFHDNDKLYFISYATVNWLDVFVREDYMRIVLDLWKFCQEKKGLEIYGWCIMLSHVHMIIGSSKNKLEDIVRDMKKYTSVELKAAIKNNYQRVEESG